MCANLQQAQTNGGNLSVSQFGGLQAQSAQAAHQHVGHGRQIQPQLIGAHGFGTDPVREQLELFFDPVLHVAAGAVQFFVE